MSKPPGDALDQARQDAGLSPQQSWLRYLGLGGMTGALEIDAMCHGALIPTGTAHARLAHALNERLTERGRDHPVPYTDHHEDPP